VARVLACSELFFGTKIKETLAAIGHETELRASADQAPADLDGVDLIVVDLDAEGLDLERLRTMSAKRPLLGFYSHVDADTKRRAEEAGLDLVVPRSRMARELPALVSSLLRD
jgi:hypothetical protein